jgi:hypothetical protein
MTGRFNEALQLLEGDIAYDQNSPASSKEENRTYMRRSWAGQLYRLKDQNDRAAEHAEILVNLHSLPCNLVPIREGVFLSVDLKELKLAERGRDLLRTIASRWPSENSQAALWISEALLFDIEADARAGQLFAKARGAWPDPLNLLAVARWQGRSGMDEAKLDTLNELDRLRGKVLKHHFAGLLVLSWIERARALVTLSRFREALRFYDQVRLHWSDPEASGKLMSQVNRERSHLIERGSG